MYRFGSRLWAMLSCSNNFCHNEKFLEIYFKFLKMFNLHNLLKKIKFYSNFQICVNLSLEAFLEFVKHQNLEWICHPCTHRHKKN